MSGFLEDARPEIVHALGGSIPTEQQWRAVAAPLEPSVLVAGAGSGKTAVMAARIVWLVLEGHVKPAAVLGLTFTKKAAANLLERVRRALSPLGIPDGEEPTILTYHAFAQSLIADYGLRAGLEPGAHLMSEAQSWQLCSELFAAETYDQLVVRSLYHVASVRQLADQCADHLVAPETVIEHDLHFLKQLEESGGRAPRDAIETAAERIELARVVERYRRVKEARHLLDYGDQIAVACRLAADPGVAADFRSRFAVALLDEYQDTNHAQAVMLRRLMPPGYPVTAVGDPDQNIYAWRGASLANLLHFPQHFPRADGSPANQMPLTVNFRSGARVLALANSLIEKIPPQFRPPDKILEPFEARGAGRVECFLAEDEVSEAERVAAEAVLEHEAGTPWREIAVLCRKKRLFGELLEAMRRREIPVEVIGLGGLLRTPEIVDLVSVLRVLDDPMRNVALARLLRGPRWRIGHRDLALVAAHARERNRELEDRLDHEYEGPGDVAFSLAEALEWVDDIEGLSDEGRARLRQFAHELAALRGKAGLPLPDVVQRALDWLGLARELDASPSPATRASKRNLANFIDRLAAYEPLDGEPSLRAMIEWLDALEQAAEDIEAAQPTDADAVKLMTIHQAKGLEFDVVFVPGLAAGERSKIFPDTTRQANPVESPKYLPFELRGDTAVLPRYQGTLTTFKQQLRERALQEERRLLYVAVTRARARLVCSAAHWYYPSGWGEALKTPMGPSEFWEEIASFPHAVVLERCERPEENPLIGRRAERARNWPPPAKRLGDPLFPEGYAAAVQQARAEVAAHDRLFAPAPTGPTRIAARSLPVSALVTMAQCPKKFYWTYVRPLPRRFSSAARIGTIVHAWIEQVGRGQATLYDPEQFEDTPYEGDTSAVSSLKDAFRRTRFFEMVPLAAERPFTLVVGDYIVHGRIDAIFERDGGWEIVDFKTGGVPELDGAERWQLDLYALAAQEIWGKRPEDLVLTFAYIRSGEERTFPARPAAEVREDLLAVLETVVASEYDPAPGAGCGSCDFLAACSEGRTFLTSL